MHKNQTYKNVPNTKFCRRIYPKYNFYTYLCGIKQKRIDDSLVCL